MQGRPHTAGQQRQPRCCGELDDGGPVPDGDDGLDRLTGRASHADSDRPEPGRQCRVERPLPAVGDRQPDDLDVCRDMPDPGRDPIRDLGRGQRPLELVRRHQHALHVAAA